MALHISFFSNITLYEKHIINCTAALQIQHYWLLLISNTFGICKYISKAIEGREIKCLTAGQRRKGNVKYLQIPLGREAI